jgi:hypothetical protein
MKFRISGDLIFDDEYKIVWHISHIKYNDDEGWNNEQKKSKNKITKWLKQNHPELLI